MDKKIDEKIKEMYLEKEKEIPGNEKLKKVKFLNKQKEIKAQMGIIFKARLTKKKRRY